MKIKGTPDGKPPYKKLTIGEVKGLFDSGKIKLPNWLEEIEGIKNPEFVATAHPEQLFFAE